MDIESGFACLFGFCCGVGFFLCLSLFLPPGDRTDSFIWYGENYVSFGDILPLLPIAAQGKGHL